VLLVVLPMRAGCRGPRRSGRPALIRASTQTAQCRSGETKRMGKRRERLGSLLCGHLHYVKASTQLTRHYRLGQATQSSCRLEGFCDKLGSAG
jgi:hypothetical protein